MAATSLASVAFGLVTFTTGTLWLAIVGTAFLAASATLWIAPGYALTQSLVDLRMRGTIAAIVFLLGNLFGYGLGPLAIGSLSDLFAGMGLAAPLKWAIIAVLCANIWAAAHFILAARHLRGDLTRAAG